MSLLWEKIFIVMKNKQVYKGFLVRENDEVPYDINFSLINSKCKIPKVVEELYVDIEKTISDLKMIFKNNEEELAKNFKLVLSLAQAGLAGENGNPYLAKKALENLKNDIIITFGAKLKTKYIKNLGIGVFIFDCFIYYIYNNYNLTNYLLVFMGALIGSWVSFCIRKLDIKFNDLVHFEKDTMPFYIRLIFIGIVSIIFAMLLKNEIITIQFGKFSLSTFFETNEKHFLFGIICGITDIKLAINLYRRSENILNVKGEKNVR